MKNKIEINVAKEDIDVFLKDIYKDIRKIEVFRYGEDLILRRFSDGTVTIKDELAFLNKIEECKSRNWKIPSIKGHTNDFIEFEYIKGIRLFNFLIELRYLYLIENSKKALEVAETIKKVCLNHLLNFQNISKELDVQKTINYPVKEKLCIPINLVCKTTNFEFNEKEIYEDLSSIEQEYNKNSSALFRDATPKNIILNISELHYNNFIDDVDRRNFIRSNLDSDFFLEVVLSKQLIHIDFTGCKYLCPPTDDLIAANLHECNFWLPSSQFYYNDNIGNYEFNVTLFVRFLRFGGRKLLYRLLNQTGHRIRFRFDYERMYFDELIKICDRLQGYGLISGNELKKVFKYMYSLCDLEIESDHLQKHFDISNITYYSGLFPDN